jgi:hypothetical protein
VTINIRFQSKKMGIKKEFKLIFSKIFTLFVLFYLLITIKILEQESVNQSREYKTDRKKNRCEY